MTKADLAAGMAKAAGGTKTAAEKAINTFIAAVCESLRNGRRVTISGFGTFVVTRRAARRGRNPRTGKVIQIPVTRVPRFKASRLLKDALR